MQVERFTHAFLQAYPDIDSTVFTVRRQDLGRIAGRFGADLHHGAAHPLTGPAPTTAANPCIGPREGLEGLIHQLATIYCPDSPAGATPWRVKTALEALRAIACLDRHPIGEGPPRYSGLIDNRRVCTMLGRDIVAELVRARELSTRMPITDAHTYELVVGAAANLFGVPAADGDLIAALHTPPPGMHLLDGFQRAVLAATIITFGPPRCRGAAASAVHVTLVAIDRDTVPTALDSRCPDPDIAGGVRSRHRPPEPGVTQPSSRAAPLPGGADVAVDHHHHTEANSKRPADSNVGIGLIVSQRVSTVTARFGKSAASRRRCPRDYYRNPYRSEHERRH